MTNMTFKAFSAITHPMATLIVDMANDNNSVNSFYNDEEKNLLSLLIIFLETTKQVSYNSREKLPLALLDLEPLLNQLYSFDDVKKLPQYTSLKYFQIAKLWKEDAFFQLDEDPYYYNEEMSRKNICVKTVKKYVNHLVHQQQNL